MKPLTFNPFDNNLQFEVLFSHSKYYNGQSTKSIYAPTRKEAIELSKNEMYWPIEYPDYSDDFMIVIIDANTGHVK